MSATPLARCCCLAVLSAVALVLEGCGGGSHPAPPVSTTCGTSGGGTQHAENLPQYTCNNCGYRPCVDIYHKCYSCTGITRSGQLSCYKYDCGTHCSPTPCAADYSTCGTKGGGDQHCHNNLNYVCYNCGLSPCVSSDGTCYSCYGVDGLCHKYACRTGHCSDMPCSTEGAKLVPAQSAASRAAGNASAAALPVPSHWVPKYTGSESLPPQLMPSAPAMQGGSSPALRPATAVERNSSVAAAPLPTAVVPRAESLSIGAGSDETEQKSATELAV